MIQLIILIILQTALLAGANAFLKISIEHLGHFSWTWEFFKNALFTWQLALAGVCGFLAFMLWCYLLKKHDFSLVYPLTSISYIFGVLMAAFFMGETVPITRWIGVVIVVIGVYFIIK